MLSKLRLTLTEVNNVHLRHLVIFRLRTLLIKKKLLNWNSYQNCSKFDSFHPHTLIVCFCRFRLLSLEKKTSFFYRGSGQKLRKQLRSDDGDFVVPFKFANNNNSAIKNSLTQNYSLTSNYKFLNFWEFFGFCFSKTFANFFFFYLKVELFFPVALNIA